MYCIYTPSLLSTSPTARMGKNHCSSQGFLRLCQSFFSFGTGDVCPHANVNPADLLLLSLTLGPGNQRTIGMKQGDWSLSSAVLWVENDSSG